MSTAFVSVASQRDNLGDSLLRRPLVRAAQVANQCHVYVGRDAADWDNLGLRKQDHLHTTRGSWMLTLIRTAMTGRTTLLLNAGELLPDRRFVISRILMLPAIAVVKARRGGLIHSGFGLRDPDAKAPIIARVIAHLSDVVTWRDELSRASMRVGTVAPDWAFSEGASIEAITRRHEETSTDRVIAISLRGDRPAPTRDWLESTRRTLEELNARVIVVCQVRRDADRCAWLAREIGGELIEWSPGVGHLAHEERLRLAYAQATWVASDRLHAVIMAITEGAVPLDLVPDRSRKLSRMLATVDLAQLPANGAESRLKGDRMHLRAALSAARSRLDDVAAAIAQRIRGEKNYPVRILHSVAPPTRSTRYANHMAATADIGIEPKFLTWRTALFARFDALHVHWPEHLVPSGRSLRARVSRLRAAIVITRAGHCRVPVLRTLHNITPHRASLHSQGERLRRKIDEMTTHEIHLVEGDPRTTRGKVLLIPHGSYREPYALVRPSQAAAGRILHFGRLEAYKGIPDLLSAVRDSNVGELRIVGAPTDAEVAAEIERVARADRRVSSRFGFVPDSELGTEIMNASLCVFPYRELHSSGAILVALSLNRPILVPRTATTDALQREVGHDWVRIYDDLNSTEIDEAVKWAVSTISRGGRPDLSDRSWQIVRARHSTLARSFQHSAPPRKGRRA